MRIASSILFVIAGLAVVSFGADPSDHLTDEQLSIHTLIREDIFAGWRAGDMDRLERAEQNIEKLLELRPNARGDLLAWRGGIELFRAVLAHESNDEPGFRQHMQTSKDAFDEAKRLSPKSVCVGSLIVGSYAMFADRLPEQHQREAWINSYEGYQILWKQQQSYVGKMPVHMRGELLAGLAQSSQRTGRQEEFAEYLDMMLQVLPKTPYARVAQRWKEDPQRAATETITCKTCHRPGRLADRLAAGTPD